MKPAVIKSQKILSCCNFSQTFSIFYFQECLVQEIDEGRPCLACEDRCTGFTAHEWR